MSRDLFTDFSHFGDRVLAEIGHGERSAQKFKYLVGVINRTLVDTHRIVLDRLSAIEQSATVNEAKENLESIRTEQLMEAFRVQGLCDTLGGLGSGLQQRTWDARNEEVFSESELTDAETFANMLYDRESEVAAVYAELLTDLTDMAGQLDEETLPALKKRAHELEDVLTSQVSDFRAKADRFMSLSE